MVAVTFQLLDQLNIKGNKSTIQSKIRAHPQFPSLIAIQDCLTDFKMVANSYSINKELFKLSQLQYPFVTYLSNYMGGYVLVQGVNNDSVVISNEKNKNIRVPKKDFLDNWDGILLFALADENSSEINYYRNRITHVLNQALLPSFCLILIYAFILAYAQSSFHWDSLILFVLTFLGLSISILLIIQTVNYSSPLVERLCSIAGQNGCNNVLKSDTSKVTSWLSWSEVGYFYFSGSFVTFVVFPQFISLLAYLNILAMPFTFYLLYHQYKLKNWCLLCCLTQALIVMEFLTFAFYSNVFDEWFIPGIFHLSQFCICFFIPMLGWWLQKSLIVKLSSVNSMAQQLSYKYNVDLFNLFLSDQKYISVSNDLEFILMGNPDSDTVITVISSPFCVPCSETHRILEEWLEKRNDFQVKLIFLTPNGDEGYATKVARHIIALNSMKDKNIVIEALHDWYKQAVKKYETWAQGYPVVITSQIIEICAKQHLWCKNNEIKYTPTVLVNGYVLNEPYKLNDLKYLIN